MKKNIFSWLMAVIALVVCLCLLPTKVQATQVEYLEPILYGQANASFDFGVAPIASEAEEYATTMEEAALVLRDQLKARKDYAVVYWSTLDYSANSFYEMFDLAVTHTGNPKEGDYISRQYERWGAQLSGYVMGNVYYLTLEYSISYYTTAALETKVDAAVATILKQLNLGNATDYQKVKGVYDWLCQNVTYDYDNLADTTYLRKHSTYAALIDRTAVCQGYATAMYRLLLELDVDVRCVGGWGYDDQGQMGAHGWNIVKLGQEYYNLDATWDATYKQQGHSYQYFLKNDADFTYHLRNNTEYDFVNTKDYPMATVSFQYEEDEAQGTIPPELTFTLNEDGNSYSVTDCDESASGELIIPATYNGKPVTSIGEGAFYGCASLTSVTIGNSVTTIGDYAFSNCGSLSSVSIPNSVATIGAAAFRCCDSLISVTIPDSVTAIDNQAFFYCYSLASVTIGDSVTTIGDYAFDYCSSLTSVTIPDSVTTIGKGAFTFCSGLTSVIIPDGVTTIGRCAFSYCDCLISVAIGNSVTTIGDSAFIGCANLSSIEVDENNPNYSSDDFGVLFDKYKTVLICAPERLSGSYNIPDSVTSIGADAFSGCKSLANVTIPDNVVTIGESAFADCDVLQYNTYDNAKYLGNSRNPYLYLAIANGEQITEYNLHSKTKFIGSYAFYYCTSLNSVTIPGSVTTIGEAAFYSCTSLTSLTMGNGVTNIDDEAFSGCERLSNVYYSGTEEQRQNITIGFDNDYLLSATWHYAEEDSLLVGDFTGDEKVNNEDVVYLLWHIMFPENYLVESHADFTGDNKVNNEDVIYLLWHIMFPESYPLTNKQKLL